MCDIFFFYKKQNITHLHRKFDKRLHKTRQKYVISKLFITGFFFLKQYLVITRYSHLILPVV